MRSCVRFTLSNTNISARSEPIIIKFYLKHQWGEGKVAFGFGLGRIGTLVSVASDSFHRPIMGNIYILFSKTTRPRAFHIFCVAIYSSPLYKSCQPCPCGSYRPRPGGVKRNKIRNHKAKSFHILYVAMCSNPLYSFCQPMPMGSRMAPPRGSLAPIDLQ